MTVGSRWLAPPMRSRGALAAVLVMAAVRLLMAQQTPPATPVGEWRQFDDRKGDLRSIVRIEVTDGELHGTIVRTIQRPGEPPDPVCDKCPGEFRDRPVEGLRFLWGLSGNGRSWDGGRILDPEDGKIYRVKLRLSEDGQTLEVRGYLGVSLFGRSQHWKRAE